MSEVRLYKVLNIIERMDITAEGTFQRLKEIQAQTKSGVKYTIMIPVAEFSKEEADKRLTKEAKAIEETLALKR